MEQHLHPRPASSDRKQQRALFEATKDPSLALSYSRLHSTLKAPSIHEVLPLDTLNLLLEGTSFTSSDDEAEKQLEIHLWSPLRHMFGRPSKNFRKRLVSLGFRLVQSDKRKIKLAPLQDSTLDKAGDLLEMLHLGSLIIDDIQDGSLERRGGPALHLTMGMPRALCAGNLLYFRALNALAALELPADVERTLMFAYANTMEKAHIGQMLDLSVKASTIDDTSLPPLCEKVALLKTGCLTAFALKLGALIGHASPSQIAHVEQFGLTYGMLLQYCDDLGNMTSAQNPAKRFEDLRQDKPTSLWALVHRLDCDTVAESSQAKKNNSMFKSLKNLTTPSSLCEQDLLVWLESARLIPRARSLLQRDIAQIFSDLSDTQLLSMAALTECQNMTEELLDAYTT